jgi:hypothetical protein
LTPERQKELREASLLQAKWRNRLQKYKNYKYQSPQETERRRNASERMHKWNEEEA